MLHPKAEAIHNIRNDIAFEWTAYASVFGDLACQGVSLLTGSAILAGSQGQTISQQRGPSCKEQPFRTSMQEAVRMRVHYSSMR